MSEQADEVGARTEISATAEVIPAAQVAEEREREGNAE